MRGLQGEKVADVIIFRFVSVGHFQKSKTIKKENSSETDHGNSTNNLKNKDMSS